MRLTVFDLLHAIIIAAASVIGARLGLERFGYPVGALAGALGATLGFLIAYAPNRLLNRSMEWSVRRKPTPALRAQLVDDITRGTYVSGLIISVLLERGDPAASFRDYICQQLRSEDVTHRRSGLYNLAICYPDLAAKLEGFAVLHPTKDDLEDLGKVEAIAQMRAAI